MRLWILIPLVLLASTVKCLSTRGRLSRINSTTQITTPAQENLVQFQGILDENNLEDGSWTNYTSVETLLLVFLAVLFMLIIMGCVGLVIIRVRYRAKADDHLEMLAEQQLQKKNNVLPTPYAVHQRSFDITGAPRNAAPVIQKEKVHWDKESLAAVIHKAAAITPPPQHALAASGNIRMVPDHPNRAKW